MRDLRAFLSQNKIKTENIMYKATKSLVDENGEPLEWEIRKVTTEESDRIRKDCFKVGFGKNGKQVNADLDTELYGAKLCVAATVYPDLKNAELQDSYNTKSEVVLLQRLLDDIGEYSAYQQKVMEICGFNVTEDDLVEEAKN